MSPLAQLAELYCYLSDLDVTEWEQDFIESLVEQQERFGKDWRLSSAQVKKLRELYDKYLLEI